MRAASKTARLTIPRPRQRQRAREIGGIPAGGVLTAMCSALLGGDHQTLDALRQPVAVEVGGPGLTDAIAVASIFNAIDRVADGAGIELDDWKNDDIQAFDYLPARRAD